MSHSSSSIARSLLRGGLAVLVALTLVAQMAAPVDAAFIRRGKVKKRATAGYKVVVVVGGDDSKAIGAVKVQIEALKGPLPLTNPVTLTFESFDDVTGDATFSFEPLEFTADAVGWTFPATAQMLTVDGKPVGQPTALTLLVEDLEPDPDVIYTDLPDGDLVVDGIYAVIRGVNFSGNITVHNATVVIDSGSVINGNINADSGSIIDITGGNTITGNIKMTDAGSLSVTGNTVTGNISAKGSGDVTVTNNTITGNLKAESSAGSVNATGNTVTGNVRLDRTHGTITMTGNTIDGNLKSSSTTGTVTFESNTVAGNIRSTADDGKVTVSNNTVTENIRAKGTPTVTITGNTIDGNLKIQNSTSCTQSGNTVSGNISGC